MDISFQLLHPSDSAILLIIEEEKVTFTPRAEAIKKILSEQGITIPYSQRASFNDRKTIKLSDSLFSKAFLEVYFPNALKKQGFQLLVQVPNARIQRDGIADP